LPAEPVFVSESGEEEYEQGFNSFRGQHRGRYFRGIRGAEPRFSRGGDRWHDGATRGRLPMPRFGNMQRFQRPGRFEGPQRFNGPHRFNSARGDGPPRFDGPGSNRFSVPRFEGRPRFDASPLFRRGGPVVQLEAPFRGGPAMSPRFPGPMPPGGEQPLLSQGFPPWYDNDEMEDEAEMQSEDFEGSGSGAQPLFDHGHPPWSDSTEMENKEDGHERSLDGSHKLEDTKDTTVASVSECNTTATVTENIVSSGSNASGEKRVRKSRFSSVPPEVAEQDSSSQPADSNIETADSSETTETVKTDVV